MFGTHSPGTQVQPTGDTVVLLEVQLHRFSFIVLKKKRAVAFHGFAFFLQAPVRDQCALLPSSDGLVLPWKRCTPLQFV